jgi:hypothetical protein
MCDPNLTNPEAQTTQDTPPLHSGNSDDNKIDIIQVVSRQNAASNEHSPDRKIGRREADRWISQ